MQRHAIPALVDRDHVASPRQRPQQLLDEEGIAFGQRVDGLQELGANCPVQLKDRLQHCSEPVASEWGDAELNRQAAPIDLV
jgi:hypothetical protein